MRKLIVLLVFLWASLAFSQTETFYVCEGGDGTLPETATCATAYDAADFSNGANWDTDDQDDGKIGPNDVVILLDDGGAITRNATALLVPQESGLSGKPITIQGESGGSAVLEGAQTSQTWAWYETDYTFSDDVESADLSAWTSTSQGAGQTLEASTSVKRQTNAIHFGIANTNESSVKKTGLTLGYQGAGGYVLVDSYLDNGGDNDSYPLRNHSSNTYLGMVFTTTEAYTLTKVVAQIRKLGSPTGNIWVEIWTTSGSDPDSLISGAVSDNVDVSTVPTDACAGEANEVEFTGFATPPALSDATDYAIVLRGDYTISATNLARWCVDNTDGYAGDLMKSETGASWAQADTDDGLFETYKTTGGGGTTEVNYSAEFNINGLTMSDGDQFGLFKAENTATAIVWQVDVRRNGSDYEIAIVTANDGGATTSWYDINKTTWNQFEIEANLNNGAGTQEFWVNHTLEETDAALDNDELDVEEVWVYTGGLDAGTTGDIYVDSVAADDNFVGYGPYVAGSVTWTLRGVWEEDDYGLADADAAGHGISWLRLNAGAYYFDNPNDDVYVTMSDGADPESHTVYVNRNAGDIYIENVDYITVEGPLTLQHGGSGIFSNTTDNVVVDSVVLANNNYDGFEGAAATTNATIQNCEAYGNGQGDGGIGIDTIGGSGSVIENNHSYDNGGHPLLFSDGESDSWSGQIQLSAATTSIVRYNLVEADTDTLVSKLPLNLEGAGTDSNDIYGNVVIGGMISISLQNSDSNEIYNNTVYGFEPTDNAHGCAGIGIFNTSVNNTVKNNIVTTTDTLAGSDQTATGGIWVQSGSETGIDIDYNLYYLPNATDRVGNWLGTKYTFANWQTNSSQDANSPTPADPDFTDAGGDDFSLLSTSPAIDIAEDLGNSYDDALDPESSWPDGVLTLDQDEHGAADQAVCNTPADLSDDVSVDPTLTSQAYAAQDLWDIGAYVLETTHTASQWQIDVDGGGFGAPVYDSGSDAVNLTTIATGAGLNRNTNYDWRVRHQNELGWGDWSTTFNFRSESSAWWWFWRKRRRRPRDDDFFALRGFMRHGVAEQ